MTTVDKDIVDGAEPPLGFGLERGRDIIIVVGQAQFHVHSIIVQYGIGGKVFDIFVEQAYENADGVVRLVDDSPEAWRALLAWIYAKADNSNPKWILDDAIAVVPLVHKYEGDKIIPSLSAAFTSNKASDIPRIRKPDVAQLLAFHHMESVVESWFSDSDWGTYDKIVEFLEGSDDNKVRLIAMSCAQKRLQSCYPRADGSNVAILLHVIAKLFPTFLPDSKQLAINIAVHPNARFARSAILAKALRAGGFLEVLTAWLDDRAWLVTTQTVHEFLGSALPEDMNLQIMARITENMRKGSYYNRSECLDLVHPVLLHCSGAAYEQAVLELIHAIPKYGRTEEVAEVLGQNGFLPIALEWIKDMSAEACQKLTSTSGQIELVRAAATQLQKMQAKRQGQLEDKVRARERDAERATQNAEDLKDMINELWYTVNGKGKGKHWEYDACGWPFKGKCVGKCGGKGCDTNVGTKGKCGGIVSDANR